MNMKKMLSYYVTVKGLKYLKISFFLNSKENQMPRKWPKDKNSHLACKRLLDENIVNFVHNEENTN